MLTITVTGMGQADKLVDTIFDILHKERSKIGLAALRKTGKVFERNFRSEGKGAGGWPPLAESTKRKREALGFGGAHPILVRYGDLRDYTALALQNVKRNTVWSAEDAQGGSIRVEVVASQNGIVAAMASGEKALHQRGIPTANVPPRPYWFVNSDVMAAAKRGAVEHIRNRLKAL